MQNWSDSPDKLSVTGCGSLTLLVVWFFVQVAQLVSAVTPILPSLSVLRLGWNRLTSLSDHSFSACPGLTELYLNNNSMASLSDHTFSGLNKLEVSLLEHTRCCDVRQRYSQHYTGSLFISKPLDPGFVIQ